MAERPDQRETHTASYSPPPNHRPDRLGQGWGTSRPERPDQGITGGWSAGTEQPSGDAGPPRQPSGTKGIGSVLVVAVVAAAFASGGTYGLLLAGGQLDRRVPINDLIAQQAAAQPATAPDVIRIVEIEQNAIIAAVEQVSPAVVTITPRGVSNGFSFPEGVASGVIYDPDGWIITNRHVVCGADSLSVQLANGQQYEGVIHGLDTLTDLAIVKIEGAGLPSVKIGNSDTLRVGQLAVAIGSPLGTFTNSVTTGVVSAKGRHIVVTDACDGRLETLRNLIQTDAAINPGNSGGALVDSGGELIGINTAIAGDAEGIGFAIPIDLARPIMIQAVEGETLSRPWMGIFYTAITPVIASQRDLPITYGALIEVPADVGAEAVLDGSPASEAGLRAADIVTHIDGVQVDGDNPLDEILTQYRPREEVDLQVLRGGESVPLTLTLGTRPQGN
jgi:S1-C subfamily serine protease